MLWTTTETPFMAAPAVDEQPLREPGLRRSAHSSSTLHLANPNSPPTTPKSDLLTAAVERYNARPHSPPPPQTYSHPFDAGFAHQHNLLDDPDLSFPNYDGLQFSYQSDEEHRYTQTSGDLDGNSLRSDEDPPEISTTTDTTRSDSPLPTPTVADDTDIQQPPSRHVDYLSHEWREEDIWASWRHIVSQRKVYGQRSRLENASWRTWAKSKYHLQTVSPDTLNWLKDSDVTWLYGPLKPATSHPITSDTSGPSSQISKNSSFVNKKPILKKRSASEVMLQKSLSTSSLVKQAAAAVQAQQVKHSPQSIARISSDFTYSSSNAPSQPPSRDPFDYFSSRPSSSTTESTPYEDGHKERHIRFDEKVEQCIAVDCKDPPFDYEDEPEVEDDPPNSALSESSSDEGLVMMKHKRKQGRENQRGKISRNNSFTGRMIETLEATTLKTQPEGPELTKQAQHHHVFGKNWGSGKLSPSPSQETLRPSRPSRNFLLAEAEDRDEPDATSSWSFGSSNPKSSLGASSSADSPTSRRGGSALSRAPPEPDPTYGYDGVEGMRRTESGMFMPYDEDEDDVVAAGLFGRVSETFNTMRDIGHVLWNVGWRG